MGTPGGLQDILSLAEEEVVPARAQLPASLLPDASQKICREELRKSGLLQGDPAVPGKAQEGKSGQNIKVKL